MNQTQFFRSLTVTTTTGTTVPLRYSLRQGVYEASGVAPATTAPNDAPYVTSMRGNAPRHEMKAHRGDYVYQIPLTWTIHQRPLSSEATPDPAAAFLLWRKLFKGDTAVTQGDMGYTFIGLTLAGFMEPQYNPATGGLLGRIQWLERVQLHAV